MDKVSTAIYLKAHLKLHAKGMRHSRLTGKDLLNLATIITLKKYPRGSYLKAVEDLDIFLENAA